MGTSWEKRVEAVSSILGLPVKIDGGESTKVGSFNQKLSADFEPSRYHGIGIWCDRFGVPFGSAPLNEPN